MGILIAVLAVACISVGFLTMVGKLWREGTITGLPGVSKYDCRYMTSTCFVIYGGAFSIPALHWSNIRSEVLLDYGDAIEVQYKKDRFSALYAVNAVMKSTDFRRYDRIVVVGASMGSILAMRTLSRLTVQGETRENAKIYLIGVDPAVNVHTLKPRQKFLATVSSRLRTGPFFNKLLKWTNLFIFKVNDPEIVSPKADVRTLRKYVRGQRSYATSAICDMNKTIVDGFRLAEFQKPLGLTVACMFSSRDLLLVPEVARAEWQKMFKDSINITVDGGCHVDFLENPDIWKNAFEQTLNRLNIQP